MALAQLTIDIIAKLAEFQKDMRQAAADSDKATSEIRKGLEGLKSYASDFILGMGAGMAAAFSVGAIREFIGANVDAADELNRLSQSTGVSVEKLSQWGAVARRNGLDVDDLAEQINELQIKLSETDKDTEGAGYALKQLGIDYNELKKLTSEEAFERVAQGLSKVEDSGQKAAMAMMIGGDEYQKYIAVLNDIGAGGLEAAAITADQALAAADLKDKIAVLQAASSDWSQSIVGGIVPALRDAALGIADVITGTGGMTEEARRMSRDGTITAWANSTVYALSYVSDLFQLTGRAAFLMLSTIDTAVRQVMLPLIGAMDAAGKALAGDFAGAGQALSNGFGAAAERGQQWVGDMSRALDGTLGSSIRARIDETERLGAAGRKAADSAKPKRLKPEFDPVKAKAAAKAAEDAAKAGAAAKKKAADEAAKANERALAEYEKLITSIRTKTEADAAEINGTAAVTDAQKMAMEVMTQIRDGRLKLTDAQKGNISTYLEELLVTDKLATAHKDMAKWIEESGAENLKARENLQQRTQSIRDQIEAERLSAEEYGLSAEALGELTRHRQLDTARALEARVAAMDSLPGFEAQTEAWREQADAIRELVEMQRAKADQEKRDAANPFKGASQGVKDYLADIAKANESARSAVNKTLTGVEDALTDAVTTGKADWKGLVDMMVKEAARLGVIRPLMKNLLGDGSSGSTGGKVADWLGNLFGGSGKGSGTGSSDGGASGGTDSSWISTAVSWVSSLWGGGRATGGPVGAGSLYQVNERGPELLTVGDKTMLMMGAEGGRVTPLQSFAGVSGGDAGGNSVVVNQTFHFSGADAVTREDLRRTAAEAKQAALAEFVNLRTRGVRGYA